MGKKLKEIRLETRHDLVKQTGDMNSRQAACGRREKGEKDMGDSCGRDWGGAQSPSSSWLEASRAMSLWLSPSVLTG